MKKLLLFAASLIQLGAIGQSMPNGSFEYWSTLNYSEPTGWNTGNPRDIPRLGVASVTKVSGFSGFAVRIENKIVGVDTSDSYMINTTNPCNDPSQWKGGVPYSQQPTAITGKYRYNLLGNDTAILLVIFRKNGAHIGDNYIKIRGTGSQSTFTSFSYTLACSAVPDSMIIAAASSDKTANNSSQNGSYIEFDNLAFTGATQTIPNGDFENWTNKTYDIPTAWAQWGNGVSQTNVSYQGALALKLVTTSMMCSNLNPSGVTSGYMSPNNGPKGGRPYTKQQDTLCGYYKYTPAGNDTANIIINLSKNGSPVGGSSKKLVVTGSSYTFFQVPFSAGTAPDSIRIDIMSSTWNITNANNGSTLYIDNLYLKSQPAGIFESTLSSSQFRAFPNPAKDVLYITNLKELSARNIMIYDGVGKCVKSFDITNPSSHSAFNIAELQSGIYYYLITSDKGVFAEKFVKE